MRLEVKMPDLATTSSTVRIVSWLKKPGDEVMAGQPLLTVETDKATMEVEAVATGILREVRVPDDTDAEVGQVIAVIETEKAENEATSGRAPDKAQQQVPPGDGEQRVSSLQGDQAAAAARAYRPSPAGVGRRGMLSRNRDTRAARRGSKTTEGDASSGIHLTAAQRVAAQRLAESKATVPHFYLQAWADAESMAVHRSHVVGEKPVWDAYFAHAASRALERFPRMKCSYQEGALVDSAGNSVGIAVDLDGELYVVRIVEPLTKTPQEISAEIRQKVAKLRRGDPESRRVRTSAMTISNIGAPTVESFAAIINPPEASILAVGAIGPQAVVVDGALAVRKRVSLTLSVDHRVVSGRYAADFLSAVVGEIESR